MKDDSVEESPSWPGPWPLSTLILGLLSLGLIAFTIVRESVFGGDSIPLGLGIAIGVPLVIGIALIGERWPRARWFLSSMLGLPGIVALTIWLLQRAG